MTQSSEVDAEQQTSDETGHYIKIAMLTSHLLDPDQQQQHLNLQANSLHTFEETRMEAVNYLAATTLWICHLSTQ